jgi:hypothetical protein
MTGQKKTEHLSQNMPYSNTESPEVGNTPIFSYEEAWQSDPQNRSQEDIFEDLVANIQRDNPVLSDADARQAARNMIAYVTEMVHVAKQSK